MLAGVPFILQDHLGFSPQRVRPDRAAVGRRLHRRHLREQPAGRPRARRSSSCAPRAGSTSRHLSVMARSFALRHRHLVGDHRPAHRAELRHRHDRGQRQCRRRRHVSQARRHGLVAGRAWRRWAWAPWARSTVAILTVVGSRYVAMPLVIGLMPFAVLTVLSARLLRARPRPPKLSS